MRKGPSVTEVTTLNRDVSRSLLHQKHIAVQLNNRMRVYRHYPPQSKDFTNLRTLYSSNSANIESMVSAAKNEVIQYAGLLEGWDEGKGRRFDPILLVAAANIIDAAAEVFEVECVVPTEITPGPVSDGSINIELGYGKKYQILSIHPDSTRISRYWETSIDSGEESFEPTHDALETAIAWLVH